MDTAETKWTNYGAHRDARRRAPVQPRAIRRMFCHLHSELSSLSSPAACRSLPYDNSQPAIELGSDAILDGSAATTTFRGQIARWPMNACSSTHTTHSMHTCEQVMHHTFGALPLSQSWYCCTRRHRVLSILEPSVYDVFNSASGSAAMAAVIWELGFCSDLCSFFLVVDVSWYVSATSL
jgi:hypothetical protein